MTQLKKVYLITFKEYISVTQFVPYGLTAKIESILYRHSILSQMIMSMSSTIQSSEIY